MRGALAPDPGRLRSALQDADLRVLLIVMYQLSGDRRWISAPYLPRRDVRLIADESAGFDPGLAQQIRDAAFGMLADGVPRAAVPTLDEAAMRTLMNACLGEEVDPEYAPLMLEDMGFANGDAQWRSQPSPESLANSRVVIIGAGLSGLGLGMQLKRLGIPFTIVECNRETGGTWFENRYPGAGVDTPNLFYSWSGHPNPNWSRYFSLRDEILAYIRDAADRFGLCDHILFGCELARASWDDRRCRWSIELRSAAGTGGAGGGERADEKGGENADDKARTAASAGTGASAGASGGGTGHAQVLDARFLVSAIGHISEPNSTRFDGMDEFEGPLFHSARWPDGLDLAGKRVAIVGTGATAMQLAPAIVERVANLTVYQRTAQWARPTPEYHREVSEGARWLFEHVPFYARWYRFTLFWRYGDGLLRFLRKDPAWPHPERSLNRINDKHREQMTEHIATELAARPGLLDRCVPTYPPYGKRILLDNGWYRMLLRGNVELVTEAIGRFDARAAITGDGVRREHDVVVLATGFSIARLSARLDIRGTGGTTLADAWAGDDPRAYLGITVPGFPNMFILYGPNTNLGHGGSAIFHAECQTRYITRTIVEAIERGIGAIDVLPEAHDDWIAKVDAEHAQLIWTHPGMSTWYRNRHGRVVSTSPFRLVDYWRMTHESDLHNYRALAAG